MKQIAQYQDGRIELQDVPEPPPPPGGILVRVTHSVISPGTERMKVEQARMNLLQKAMARPDQVRKVLQTAKTLGWKNALAKVRNRLETPTPLGYSLAGVVEEVAADCMDFRVGDRVACGGAECAVHAERVAIPAMLAAHVPDGVALEDAAYTTLASIAMQAVRQLDIRLGEYVAVYGQGMVGLLCTALCHAAGARVLAVDVQASKLHLASVLGAEKTINARETDVAAAVRSWTQGLGVDGILLCTGGDSTKLTREAATILRDRARLVIVGITDVTLPWRDYYAKEIEVRWSRSYGPGRYDPSYEWGGADYPAGYVRWTEKRNFEACLALMQKGRLPVAKLTSRTAPFMDALAVYAELAQQASPDVGIVLTYDNAAPRVISNRESGAGTPAPVASDQLLPTPVTKLDVVGAGNFAKTMLLPHLKGKISLGTVVTQSGLSGSHARQKFGFAKCATDSGPVLDLVDAAVVIATRHHLHAPQIIRALAAGRHIFIEKPLCLTELELAEIDLARGQSSGSVMVGFNRRFAPASVAMRQALRHTTGPFAISVRVNAGALAPDHWYANASEAGGRMIGEGCHFFDFVCSLIAATPVRVNAQPLGSCHQSAIDAFASQIEFADGSSAQILYTAEGDARYPKETATVFGPNLTLELENFQTLRQFQNGKKEILHYQSKGHAEEVAAWLGFLRGETVHPFSYSAIHQSMAVTFSALRSIQSGGPVDAA